MSSGVVAATMPTKNTGASIATTSTARPVPIARRCRSKQSSQSVTSGSVHVMWSVDAPSAKASGADARGAPPHARHRSASATSATVNCR